MIKPITKRERRLMKAAFDAARNKTTINYNPDIKKFYIFGNLAHGNFKDFLFKGKYKVK